jgi:hypothetical protein
MTVNYDRAPPAPGNTSEPAPYWAWFLPRLTGEVTRAIWQPRKSGQRPWFMAGGCLFWLVVIYFVAAVYAFKLILWMLVIKALVIAQLAVTIGQAAWWPVHHLRSRTP